MQWVDRVLRLVAPLDGGELATVYRASDPEQGGRIRAVAVLHQNLPNVEAVAERLLERIDVARGLQHPAHVACEGVFLVGGRPALVMDHIEGKDLERIAKRKALPGPVAAHIGLQVVELLQQAKSHGVVHGLVSPTRIRVDTRGQVRVLGMGAKTGSSVDADDPLYKEDRSVRRYAPPELIGGLLTSATDVYALGAVLTLLVSGRWPKRPSVHSSGQAVVADGARTVLMHAGASESLAQLVKECMAFRSDFRPTLDEMHAVLHEEAIDTTGWRRWVGQQILTVTDSTELSDPDEPRGVQMPGEPPQVIESPAVANPSVDLAEQETTLREPDSHGEESPTSGADSLDEADTLLDEPNTALDESETLLHEVEDDASDEAPTGLGVRDRERTYTRQAQSDSKGDLALPPLLGSLPPPDTDDVSVRPLAIADVHTDDVEQTEWTEDPDTVDEIVEEAGHSVDSVLDENADHWDRMLGLDVKADTDIDKDWIRAARGQGEYSQRIMTSFMVVFFGVLAAWAVGWLDPLLSNDAPPSSVIVPAKKLEPTLPVESVPEVVPVAVPEPEPAAAPPVDAVRTPARTRRRVAPSSSPPQPSSPPEPSTPPISTPPPTTAQAPSVAPDVSEEAPTPSTAAIRVTGDAHRVQFLDGTRRISGGRLPAGSYTIEVVFREGDAMQQQGQITIEPGQSAIVNCKASFYRCSIRGPW